jgi:hypothetical protein
MKKLELVEALTLLIAVTDIKNGSMLEISERLEVLLDIQECT